MDEQAWLTLDDPEPMFAFLRTRGSERKWRLLACGCCRIIWAVLPDEECRRAVEAGELLADGRPVPDAEAAFESVARRYRSDYRVHGPASHLTAASQAALLAFAPHADGLHSSGAYHPYSAVNPAEVASQAALRAARAGQGAPAARRVSAPVAALLRCLFGNPYKPLAVPAEQRTPDVLALASTIYNERTFTELPALADALEEAGCAEAAALAHLRGPGAHARGCHVLDAILGLA